MSRSEIQHSNELNSRVQVRSHITIMTERYRRVEAAAAGYERTRIPLVALEEGHLVPAARSDDVGLAFIASFVIANTHWPTGITIDFILVMIATIGAISALIAIQVSIPRLGLRVLGFAGVALLTAWGLRCGDVYITQFAVLLGTIPWVVYMYREAERHWAWMFAALVIGFAAGCASLIRGHAGTGVLLCALVITLSVSRFTVKVRAAILLALLIGAIAPSMYMKSVVRHRDQYLATVEQDGPKFAPSHVLWHTIYLGLGYVQNPYVSGWLDEVAAERVCQMAPDVHYVSAEYEQILRSATIQIAKDHPGVIAANVAAKIARLAGALLLVANIGLIAAYRRRKPLPLDLAFCATLAFNSLYGIIAIPRRSYVLGFTVSAALFAFYSIVYYAEARCAARPPESV